jgi:hypothetical protein
MNYRKLLILLTAAALTACVGPAGKEGVAGLVGAAGDTGGQGIIGDNGTDGQDLAAPEAAIASVAPNALLVGRATTLRVVGYFTQWDETTTVSATDADGNAIAGVEVATVVVSPVGLVVTATVAADAALGALQLHVATGDSSVTYAPAGASVSIAATAVSNQTELRAGELFDILLEAAEYMRNPSVNAENCLGMDGVLTRYSQYKFRLAGFMHPAASLGDCAISLVQDADTDDTWSSAAVVSITAPDVVTFNEGVVAGELTPERNFRVISINVGAGEVVSVRHTIDEDNGLDGTGSPMWFFIEGNTTPVAGHDGGNSWLEVGSVEARELLLVTQDANLSEGDDNAPFNLTILTPNTTMTALQDGATQDQRLPQNGDGANEAGRSSWYSFTNEGPVWASLHLAPADAGVLQPRMALIANDEVLAAGEDTWEGILPAGVVLLRVWDGTADEQDGVLSFAIQLARTTLQQVDENGAGTGTLRTGTVNSFLIDVPEGRVASFTATRQDGADVSVTATWSDGDEAIATGTNHIAVPSASGGRLVVNLSADGDLGEGAAYTASFVAIEPAALDFENGNAGNAPENGAAWFVGTLETAAIGTLNLTPGTADHLQAVMGLYADDGAAVIRSVLPPLRTLLEDGTFFLSVADAEFVAEQDQSFTLTAELNTNPIDVACFQMASLDVGDTERGEFVIEGDVARSGDFYPANTARDTVMAITLENPATIDMYTVAGWDTVLYVHEACGEDWGDRLGVNDDGDDWDGNELPDYNSGLHNLSLPAGTTYIIVTAYSRWSSVGPFALRYRLRDAQ